MIMPVGWRAISSSITNVPTEVNSWYNFRISAFSGQSGTVGLAMTNLAEGQQQNDPIANTPSPSPTTPPHHRTSSSKKTSKSTKSSKSSKTVLGIKTKRTKSGGFGSSKKRLVQEHNNTRVWINDKLYYCIIQSWCISLILTSWMAK